MIIDSIRSVWVDQSCGLVPEDVFIATASSIAEKIIQNTQMSLLQSSTFDKIVKNSRPLRETKKAVKKVVKKVKRHARR
jgi:hypothetical protein